ncbi:MAG: PorT family protein [Prevotellaceae bacterium]|jgi:hypothetical protein|nr:PorT family protein [Prevotellaceae bacterium]
MKKLFFAALILFVSIEASAQLKLGLKGGWDFLNFDIRESFEGQLKTDNSIAWNLGVVAQVKLSGNLYLQPEILYSSQRKIEVKPSSLMQPNPDAFDSNAEISYFQVPINILYKFNILVVEPFISGGAYFGYAINRKMPEYYSKESIKKTDWGVSIGAGVDFWKFQISARYNWGLQDISEVSDIKWKNNKFNVSVAFFIL